MTTGTNIPPSDLDLMRYADGELDERETKVVEDYLAKSEVGRMVVDSLRTSGEALRTHLEVEADRAEVQMPAFAGLWDRIDHTIQAQAKASEQAAPAPAAAASRAEAAEGGLWSAIRRWFEEHRGHVLTGAISAGAVAALMLALGPRERVIERYVAGPTVVNGTPASGQANGDQPQGGSNGATQLASQPAEVEDLEVYQGSGTVLTIEGEGAGDSATTVIWISPDDEETMEDPI